MVAPPIDIAQILGEVVPAAEQDKADGNKLFQEGRFMESAESFSRGIALFDDVPSNSLTQDARRLLTALLCNSAQALLKCDAPGAATVKARGMANRALTLDPANVKALFRRGCALSNSGEWEAAIADFNRVLELQPSTAAARQELLKAQQKMSEQNEANTDPPLQAAEADGDGHIDDFSDCDSPPPLSDEEGSEEAEADDRDDSRVLPEKCSGPQQDLEALQKKAAEAVSMAKEQVNTFKTSLLEAAGRANNTLGWKTRIETVESSTEAWVTHQLSEPEMVHDIVAVRGPVFGAMSLKQKREFMLAFDFMEEMRSEHAEAMRDLFSETPVVFATDQAARDLLSAA